MKTYARSFAFLAASALAFTLMGAYSAGPLHVPQLPLPPSGAMIYNAGNGDYAGYRIVVSPNGTAAAVDGAGRTSNQLQADVAQKFFSDLASAGPLDNLPAGDCSTMKTPDATTIEVNAAVVITWNGQHTPALTCVTDPRAIRILLDATTIQHALYVQAYRKRTMMAYGGGYTYKGDGYTPGGNAYVGNEGRFYIDNFQNSAFSYDQFSSGSFVINQFHNEYPSSNGPTAVLPASSQVFTNLPYATPFVGPQWGQLPTVYPWEGAPGTAINTTSPWSSPPGGSGPYSGTP